MPAKTYKLILSKDDAELLHEILAGRAEELEQQIENYEHILQRDDDKFELSFVENLLRQLPKPPPVNS